MTMIEARTPDGTLPVRRLPARRFNQLVARLGGYFWLPCPTCGQMNGGHEWDGRAAPSTALYDAGLLPDRDERPSEWTGTGLCPACLDAGVHVTWIVVSDTMISVHEKDLVGPQGHLLRRYLERGR